MPGIAMFAETRTVPTSRRSPDGERNSIVNEFLPVRSVPVGARSTISMSPDRTVWTTPPPAARDPAFAGAVRISRQAANDPPASAIKITVAIRNRRTLNARAAAAGNG